MYRSLGWQLFSFCAWILFYCLLASFVIEKPADNRIANPIRVECPLKILLSVFGFLI